MRRKFIISYLNLDPGLGTRKTFRKKSCARGYHTCIYKEQWDAVIGEELACQHELGNAPMLKILHVFSFCHSRVSTKIILC